MAIHRYQAGEMISPETQQFLDDSIHGLQQHPKALHSKYFYDAEGDKLFQQIMDSPEYYLTRCEMEIFTRQSAAMAQLICQGAEPIELVELGAGDAIKSTHLLKELTNGGCNFTYVPIDISANVISLLSQEIPARVSGINMRPLRGEYLKMLDKAYEESEKKKVLMFLGSNIGNFTRTYAKEFLREVHQRMHAGDLLLIGIDLKKNPHQVRAAYNDKAGVTREFNLNLLRRMNRELEANFEVDKFVHYPTYNPVSGECRSYLVSLEDQDVQIGDHSIHFEQHEPIYLELSQKYSLAEIAQLAGETGFEVISNFTDSNNWFVDSVWEKR